MVRKICAHICGIFQFNGQKDHQGKRAKFESSKIIVNICKYTNLNLKKKKYKIKGGSKR